MIELLNPIIIFALVFFGLAVRGLLEARLERRHADVLKDLGGGLILVPPAAPSGRREWAWAKFMAWKHLGPRPGPIDLLSLGIDNFPLDHSHDGRPGQVPLTPPNQTLQTDDTVA
ncbi:MAG: hypothetical protein IPK00_25425 [Deltaproteobacteria bacterium]|nr:hypothetical protein [Deltaproteobacteria bacterium]